MADHLIHDDYTIAWIAVLPIEAEAALGMLDKQHQGQFESVRGDDYIYIGGEINGHNVVVATWPAGQNYGVGATAALVNQVKARFTNIWFALLVGVAAGIPNLAPKDPRQRRDIRLGDVLVCVPDKANSGIVHYDLGKDTEAGFLLMDGKQRPRRSCERRSATFNSQRRNHIKKEMSLRDVWMRSCKQTRTTHFNVPVKTWTGCLRARST
jgi:nucleoside phosphorylase